jgi:hypothetical protein
MRCGILFCITRGHLLRLRLGFVTVSHRCPVVCGIPGHLEGMDLDHTLLGEHSNHAERHARRTHLSRQMSVARRSVITDAFLVSDGGAP